MWNGIFQQTTLPAIEQTLFFTERRHAIFGQQRRQRRHSRLSDTRPIGRCLSNRAQRSHGGPAYPSVTGDAPFRPNRNGPDVQHVARDQAMHHVRESMKQILYHDGSDVGLETQVTEIAKNHSMHSMMVGILRNQFHQLQMAIAESVNV